MVTKHILSPVVETSIFRDLTLIEKTAGDYALQHNSFYAPVNANYQKGNGSYVYDSFGRLEQVLVDGKKEMEYKYHYKE